MQSMVEMGEIRVFPALAGELHFGHTADRLGLTQSRVSQGLALKARCSYLAPVARRRQTSQLVPPSTTRPAMTMPTMAPAGSPPPPAAATGRVLAWPEGTRLGVGAGVVADARTDAVKATT